MIGVAVNASAACFSIKGRSSVSRSRSAKNRRWIAARSGPVRARCSLMPPFTPSSNTTWANSLGCPPAANSPASCGPPSAICSVVRACKGDGGCPSRVVGCMNKRANAMGETFSTCASSFEKVEVLQGLQTQPRNIHAGSSPPSPAETTCSSLYGPRRPQYKQPAMWRSSEGKVLSPKRGMAGWLSLVTG